MESKIEKNQISFHGVLDENTNVETLARTFNLLENKTNIEMDFSSVLYANSVGILNWLKILEKIDFSITYINAPYWLIKQFNMIPQLLDGKHTVKSIHIPFFCNDLNHELNKTYIIGEDIPIMDSYADFELQAITHNGHEYLPEVVPADYLEFISQNIQIFRGNKSA